LRRGNYFAFLGVVSFFPTFPPLRLEGLVHHMGMSNSIVVDLSDYPSRSAFARSQQSYNHGFLLLTLPPPTSQTTCCLLYFPFRYWNLVTAFSLSFCLFSPWSLQRVLWFTCPMRRFSNWTSSFTLNKICLQPYSNCI